MLRHDVLYTERGDVLARVGGVGGSRCGLPERLHASLVAKHLGHRLVGHVSQDTAAVPAREKATPEPPKPAKRRRGRPPASTGFRDPGV
jgi:transcriptional regulator GlxA family with amidase domain